MYEVRIYEGEAPALITNDRKEALQFWKENKRSDFGQVGVFDRTAYDRKEYPWIA
jgi:hypothetical protein